MTDPSLLTQCQARAILYQARRANSLSTRKG
jgi:hypothetical protein